MPNRRRGTVDNATIRRSTNACHRCKSKKIKCHFSPGSLQSSNTCFACAKSGADCVFDVTPDGIPRGAEYVATLESRIVSLEEQLRAADQASSSSLAARASPSNTSIGDLQRGGLPAHDGGSRETNRSTAEGSRHDGTTTVVSPTNTLTGQITTSSLSTSRQTANDTSRTRHKVIESASDGITIFNFLMNPPVPVEPGATALPEIPSVQTADSLLETAYLYTQGRYCIVDWVQIGEWHRRRESICYARNDPESQTGACFLWMMYAIGSQLTPGPKDLPAGYYSRALQHLPVILSQQNLTTVQALLVLVQYFYRSPGGPSIWHIAGAAMRLCVELGLHRRGKRTGITAYRMELQKRLFWCAYCFDRSVSILSKRPFSIHDADIDAELPVDIDVMCIDQEAIQERQAMQEAGEPNPREGSMSTIMASLHHLHMYRLQSRIVTRFTGLHAPPPNSDEIWSFLHELDDWRAQASRNDYPQHFPQQSHGHVQAAYYLTALLLLRPVLAQSATDDDLLQRCAALSAEACENEKSLCFSPQLQNSPVRTYNSFRYGLTLLQCLAIRPTIIPARSALRAINACSGALAVYTGALAVSQPYLQLFDRISDHFLGYNEDGTLGLPNDNLRALLQRVTSCEPSEIPELLKSLSTEEASGDMSSPVADADATDLDDPSQGLYSSSTLSMDLMMPFEILDDSLRPDVFQDDMMGFWAGSSAF